MQRDIAGGRGEVAVIVAAAVALSGLVTLVARRLGERFCLFLQQLVQRLFDLPRTNSFSSLLITSSFSCTIFSDMVCLLLSEWCVVTSF